MIGRRLESIENALRNFPDRRGWGKALLLYLLFAAFALPISLGTGLIAFQPLRGDGLVLASLPFALLLKPAFVEEFVFRAALVPHPSEGSPPAQVWIFAAASLAVFVAMHPVNALLVHNRAIFLNPAFLAIVLALGALCTIAYRVTGSLWPPVFMHWSTVVVWFYLFGGASQIGFVARVNHS